MRTNDTNKKNIEITPKTNYYINQNIAKRTRTVISSEYNLYIPEKWDYNNI